MSRTSLATPCPAPRAGQGFPTLRRFSTASSCNLLDDTCTAEIDYTRAIQHEFENARPRRRAAHQRKAVKNAGITIFEDMVEDQELVVDGVKALGGSTLLAKPAKKMPFRPEPKMEKAKVQPLGEIGQARQRASIMTDALVHETTAEAPTKADGTVKNGLKKDPRRRTIFVPSDETTLMTIHPGADNTDRLNDTFQLPTLVTRASPVKAKINFDLQVEEPKPIRRARMSLAAAPKRLPLQQMATKQNNLPGIDVAGQNGGKENLPPKVSRVDNQRDSDEPVEAACSVASREPAGSRSRLFAPTAASQARQSVHTRRAVPVSRAQVVAQRSPATVARAETKAPSPAAKSHQSQPAAVMHKRQPYVQRTMAQSTASEPQGSTPKTGPVKRQTPPKRSLLAGRRLQSKVSQYPVLAEDVSQPQLYEDSWLSQQEIALTELVNEIFETARLPSQDRSPSAKPLRESLINIYHQPHVATLYKRLQASLLYGALSRPKDMPSPPNPANDIGLRKRFLSLWLDSYEESALRAAAEVVVGRQVPCKARNMSNGLEAGDMILDPAKERRALIGFLETFFVSVEDGETIDEESKDVDDASGRHWRKMIIRSLMMVWLLDQGKISGAVHGCLFKRTSSLKSSASVLHALSGMLIPSIGDVLRGLRHLEYTVEHAQDPLDEVNYHINNIAVDLRDGVFLTRLVELLLFPPSQRTDHSDADTTIAITLPDATILESVLYLPDGSDCLKILSQHLKMPCLGRAQKAHNVQVALSALIGCDGLAGHPLHDITADDIVNGHREKTLALLWSLVSHYGLTHLIDWNELIVDVQRATGERSTMVDSMALQAERENLLQAWAAAHCKAHGLQLDNLTTAFADRSAYAAILDDYRCFLPAGLQSVQSARNPDSKLESGLRSLGCSAAFIRQFSASNAIPARTTTISNLAFLASRLLPLARRHTAAVCIQRCFRRLRSRVTMSQRIALMRMAHACATIIRTRDTLSAAATVLQRAWRSVLDGRLARLNSDVGKFQSIARAWTVHRGIVKARMSGLRYSQSLRVMGGW